MKKMLHSLTVPNLSSEIFLKQYLRSYDVRSSLAGSKDCEASCELPDFFDWNFWEDFVRAESVYAGYIQCIRHNVFTIQYSFYINRQYRDTNWNYVNRDIFFGRETWFSNSPPASPDEAAATLEVLLPGADSDLARRGWIGAVAKREGGQIGLGKKSVFPVSRI